MRWFVLPGVLAGLACLSFILLYAGEPSRVYIFDYLLRKQDLPGAALVIFIAIAAAFPPLARPALALIDWIARKPWATALVTFLVLCAGQLFIAKDHALAGDEHLILLQAKAFAAGHLTARFPPELLSWVVPRPYVDLWLYASPQTGAVVSVYWPGFALLLAPFALLGIPWACNPLLASGALVLIGRLAGRLTGAPQAAGWAMLLALASPAFGGMALGYFSMTAHLFFNLLYVWALLERRLLLAGVVGSFALVLHNPWPHFLFALPWIAWIAWHDGRRALLRLIAGYAPLTLLIGGGWWLLMRKVQGQPWFAPQAGDFLFYWQLQLTRVFTFPDAATLAKRAAELVKLWLWTVPALPALMLVGWWLARRQVPLRLLGLSFAATLAGYLIVWFDQGYGWGVRYLHPALGALPVLGAAAIAMLQSEALRRYAAAAALLSLALATPFRWAQIESFMSEQLSRRPPFENGVRQIVFVTLDYGYYTQDFVQNDPFLRAPVIFMLSRGRAADEKLLRERFPGARLSHEAPYGHVWRLD
ncbi:MAG TPA: hypothetical protein VLJ12_04615 [Burkholderiales bacterium]|nr:hypothetical protein [Burkholderiales bacterium]